MSTDEGNEELQLDESLIVQEESTEEVEETSGAVAAQEPEEEIPSKYSGKSAAEIIRMHQDAERLIGKQGNEVGELRKMVDDILASAAHAQPSAPQEPDVDFFEDPKGAISKTVNDALKSDPRLAAIERQQVENAEMTKRQQAAQELSARHPDYMEVVQSPEFGEWIGKSKVRTRMFAESHTSFDTDVANELLDQWKERQSYVSSAQSSAKAKRGDSVKAASAGSGKASSETRGKPTLSREALIELKRKDPDRYYAMMPQIKAAYMDGRVQ